MKICFLSLPSYDILTKHALRGGGGAEIQQIHLAKELVAHGFDICFVTYHNGRNDEESVDGIKVIKTYEGSSSRAINKTSNVSKYLHINSSLKKADADIYFHSSGSPGVLPLYCYINKKKFVKRISSDATVLSKPLFGKYSYMSKIVDGLEIRRADKVIAQSEFQRRMIKERFGVESVVIKNGLPIPQVDHEKSHPPTILWVGSISSVKQPHLFLELAESLPHAHFDMVGGSRNDQLYEDVYDAAKKIPNLTFHGFVPYQIIDRYYKRSSIFVNTSRIEGFPNTFIEAWMHSTPVVSLKADPDNVIKNMNLGFCSGTFKQLISDTATLLGNRELREKMGNNGRMYVEKEHDVRETAKKYIKVFESVC